MMSRTIAKFRPLVAALLPAGAGAAHSAEPYPNRPIRLVVGFCAGGPISQTLDDVAASIREFGMQQEQ